MSNVTHINYSWREIVVFHTWVSQMNFFYIKRGSFLCNSSSEIHLRGMWTKFMNHLLKFAHKIYLSKFSKKKIPKQWFPPTFLPQHISQIYFFRIKQERFLSNTSSDGQLRGMLIRFLILEKNSQSCDFFTFSNE